MSFGRAFPSPYGFAPQPIFFQPLMNRGFPASIQPTQQKGPNTTVFVGNITERCSNDFMEKMLRECGSVNSWKRIQGAQGKYQAFGFCEFLEPVGTLRALRILNDFQVGEKKLVVKAEDKVRQDLRAWAIAKRKEEGKPELKLKDHELPADEDDKNTDEEIRLKILNWIEQDHPELLTAPDDGDLSDSDKKKNREEKRKSEEKKVRQRRSRSGSRSSRRKRRSPSPKRRRRRSYSSSSRGSASSRRSSSSESSRSRTRSASPKRKRRSLSRESDSDAEEKKVLKQKLKKRERDYQERLKKWEDREKDKARYYDKLERKEKDRKLLIIKESKKLKNFLEEYNDEEDDAKYFRHSELFRRKRDFEQEKQKDAKDRMAEENEIKVIKQELMEQKKLQDVDAERVAREKHRSREEAALRKLRADSGSPNPHQKLGRSNGATYDSSSSSAESEDEKKSQSVSPTSSKLGFITTTVQPEKWTTTTEASTPPPKGTPNSGIAMKTNTLIKIDATKKTKVASVFGTDDDDDGLRNKSKLKMFEVTVEERMETITDIEKQKLVKEIINKIPTTKEDVFNYKMLWNEMDEEFMKKRVRPWVSKKVSEYIGTGEPEQSLCDFITEKVKEQVKPQQLIEDVKMILDDDAEMFVVKLWRLLIFETECKTVGLKADTIDRANKKKTTT